MTQTDPAKPANRSSDIAAQIARLVLGGSFIYMGLSKAVLHDPADFLKLVNQYHIVSSPFLLNSIAGALPWFEVYCGLLLVAGIAVRGTALVLLAMLIPFTALVLRHALAIASAKHLAFCAVKFDCGCGNGEVFICHKLTENGALIALALWLALRPVGRLCVRFGLFKPQVPVSTSPPASARPA